MGTVVITREPAMVRYIATQTITLTITVRDDAGALADPSDVVLNVTRPEGVTVEYSYDDSELTRSSTGIYTLSPELEVAGRWVFYAQTEGSIVASHRLAVTVDENPLGEPADTTRILLVDNATEEGTELVAVSATGGAPWVWQKRRGWIDADVDLTGAVNSDPFLRAKLAIAGARPGACVYVPDGRVLLAHTSPISVPAGVTLAGSPQGMRSGPFQVGGYDNVGTQFEIPALNDVAGGTARGDLFTLGVQSRIAECGFYYKHQNVNSTPVAYGWTILMPNIGCHVENVFGVNPYQFIKNAGGGKINSCWGYPLLTGVRLGRVPDAMVVTECRWNPTSLAALGTSTVLQAWVADNGRAFAVDGAESFMFSGCFAFGYQTGLRFDDEDADGFNGSSGSWYGGGFDGTEWGVLVAGTHGLSIGGLAMFGATLTTVEDGVGVLFADDQVPGSDLDIPSVELYGCHGNAPPAPDGGGRFVWMTSTSRGRCVVHGGKTLNVKNEPFRNDSTAATLIVRDFGHQSGTTRSAGRVTDNGAWFVDKPNVTLSENGETNGALLTDADATITVDQGAYRVIPPATLSANRTIDVDNGVAVTDELLTIDRRDAGAFTVTVRDNADATIFTFPVSLPMKATFRKASGGNFVALGGQRRQA